MAESEKTQSENLRGVSPPLFEIALTDGSRFSPRSTEEIRDWLTTERTAFSWLRAAQQEDNPIDYIINHQLFSEKHANRFLTEVDKPETTPERRAQLISEYANVLKDLYQTKRAVSSQSAEGKFVLSLVEKDKVVAAHALWSLMGHDPQGTSRPSRSFRGQVLAALFRSGLEEMPRWEADSFAELKGGIEKEHETLRGKAAFLEEQFRKIRALIEKLHSDQESEYKEAHVSREKTFNEQKAAHDQQMGEIQKTFKTDLALRAAVNYLNTKAGDHAKKARSFAWAAGIAGAIVLVLAIAVVVWAFRGRESIPTHQIAVVLLGATLAFWLLRILVRVLLSNLHLEQDMRTRATFVHTYLALMADGKAIEGEDREKIIALVFRPTSDGLVRDDAAPPGWLSWITGGPKG